MQKLNFETTIDAPRELVWKTMLEDATYRDWTTAFSEGSRYEGSWTEGSEIKFLDPNGQGMYAKIAASREPEYLEIRHLGLVDDGKVITEGPEVAKWAPADEIYEFIDRDGATLLRVTMDAEEEHAEMFSGMWPNALARLKSLCET